MARRAGLAGLTWLALFQAPAAELPALAHRTVVIAHRGEHRLHPENTLPAIEGAIQAGADFTEMDVRVSRDGRHLLMHDATVDRTTDGHGLVSSLPWEELSRRIVRDRRQTNIPPSRIPLLEQALQACRGRIHIYLDFKAGNRREVAALIHAAGMDAQVIVYDGTHGLTEWRSVAPQLAVITSPPKAALGDPVALRAFVEQHHPHVLDEAPDAHFVAAAAGLGVQTWPDIQRSEEGPDYWQSIWDRGVRGFQTDHPAELVRWLEQTGRR